MKSLVAFKETKHRNTYGNPTNNSPQYSLDCSIPNTIQSLIDVNGKLLMAQQEHIIILFIIFIYTCTLLYKHSPGIFSHFVHLLGLLV